MPQFDYQGRDASGKTTSGTVDGMNMDTVAGDLLAQGITPVRIAPATASSKTPKQRDSLNLRDRFAGLQHLVGDKVRTDDLLIFCRQMYALIKAGVPLMRTLHGMAEASSNKSMKRVLQDVAHQLESGLSLSASLQSHPRVFPPIVINMVHIGENTGQLDNAFLQIGAYLEMDKNNKKRIKQATRYPTVIITAMALAITVINVMVIPAFTQVFARMGTDLPLATRFLIGMSSAFTNYWWLMLLVIVGGIIGLKYYQRTSQGAYVLDRVKLKIPLLGPLTERIVLSRFCRTLSMLLSAGVPTLQALSSVSRSIGNSFIARSIDDMRQSIEGGESLSRSAAATRRFTPMVLQMMAVGEETGSTDTMLLETAEFYDEAIDYDLKRLSDALEPILLVFMGALVLLLALGIFMPMWSMGSAMTG